MTQWGGDGVKRGPVFSPTVWDLTASFFQAQREFQFW